MRAPNRSEIRAAFAVGLALAGASCSTRAERCEEACTTKLGASQETCARICSHSCEEMRKKFGVAPDFCEWLLGGAPGDPPARRL